jgi:hypothetical protein
MNKKIFVSISSYRDQQLANTVSDLLAKAKDPSRLILGICHQNTDEELADFSGRHQDERFRLLNVNYQSSRGCCWARTLIQGLIRDEDLYLQLDAHHRFVQDWDAICEQELEKCQAVHPKSLLSTYATICTMSDLEMTVTHGDVPFKMSAERFYDFPKVKFVPREMTDQETQVSHMISGHFIFAPIDWTKEIPYDPELYFDGEEDTLALRSWTRGWNIYVPNRVILYHYYLRLDERRHHDDHDEWHQLNQKGKERLRQIWNGTIVGVYGLGNQRSLSDYARETGIDYARMTIDQSMESTRVYSGPKMLFFRSVNGLLMETNGDEWLELGAQGRYHFRVVPGSTGDLELFDESRQVGLRYLSNCQKIQAKHSNLDWFDHCEVLATLPMSLQPAILGGRKRIGLLSLSTPNLSEFATHSRLNQELYCRRHGYHYLYYSESFLDQRLVTWNKVYAIKRHLWEFDWVCWIDADAIFTNHDVQLEEILEKSGDRVAIFSDDIGGWQLNTGVMLWKNSPVANAILERWLLMEKKPHSEGAEQSQLIDLLKGVSESDYIVLPRRFFNQHPDEHSSEDFVLHMMGKSGPDRARVFESFNQKLFR